MLPLRSHQTVAGLDCARNVLVDAVTQPQQLQLMVALSAQSQRVASPQTLICLAVVVEVGRCHETASVGARHQHDLTLPHSQEHARTRTTHVCMVHASTHQNLVEFRLTAVALRAEHLTADQAHGRVARVLSVTVGAGEQTDCVDQLAVVVRQAHQLVDLQRISEGDRRLLPPLLHFVMTRPCLDESHDAGRGQQLST